MLCSEVEAKVSELLQRHMVGAVIEADLQLIKDACASKQIKTSAKAFRETHGSRNFPCIDMDGQIMHRDKVESILSSGLWRREH